MWLRIVLLSTLICVVVSSWEGKKQKCKELEECAKEENNVSCARRFKRHCQGSSNSCNECDCNYCSNNDCSSSCNTCCANFAQPCTNSYCCYKTCHAQCASSACRKSCRSSCTRKVTEGQSSSTSLTSSTKLQQAQAVNVTTVINLHNKINNTNEIDIPVNVNSTNYNNFTIDTGNEYQGWHQTSGSGSIIGPPSPIIEPTTQFPPLPSSPPIVPPYTPPYTPPLPLPTPQQPSCCQVIGPRQCTPLPQYPFARCFHLRKRQCGSICSSSIMHAQQHRVCEEVNAGSPTCHNQIIYIPQPQTRCVYQQAWPYVSCGIQQPNCEGCYGPQVTEERKLSCSPMCFQDQFGDGRYFKQGPVVGPAFNVNPAINGVPFAPNYENSYSITMDPSKRSNQESNAIDPPQVSPSTPLNNNPNNLAIEVIQDGVSINEVPSALMPYPMHPFGQYSPYPYPPLPPPYPFWGPPPPGFPGMPPPEGEMPPLFAEKNYLYKRGVEDKPLLTKVKKDESLTKSEKDQQDKNEVPKNDNNKDKQ